MLVPGTQRSSAATWSAAARSTAFAFACETTMAGLGSDGCHPLRPSSVHPWSTA